MARRCCVAATLVLLFAPWAWSDGLRPEPGVGADTAGERSEAEKSSEGDPPMERSPAERASELLRRLVAQSRERQKMRIEMAPDYRRLSRGWPCRAGGVAGAQTPPARSDSGEAAEDWFPCEFGRRLAEMPPCLNPHDCEALQLWQDKVGSPSVEQARPPADPPPAATAEDDRPSPD